MRYTEFSLVADDGEQLRIRMAWPDDPASEGPPTYDAIGEPAGTVVEVLPEGRYCVNGKVYTAVAQD